MKKVLIYSQSLVRNRPIGNLLHRKFAQFVIAHMGIAQFGIAYMGIAQLSCSTLTTRSASSSVNKLPVFLNFDPYKVDDLSYLQRNYENLLREYEGLQDKMTTTTTSIKSFWSPELKKERMLRKEETSKCFSLQEQLKSSSQENRKQSSIIEQLQNSCLNSQLPCHSNMVIATTVDHDIILAERNRLMHEALIASDRINDLEAELADLRLIACKKAVPNIGPQAELDVARCRIQDLETRCRHLESIIDLKDQDLSILRNECLNASEKFQELEKRSSIESGSSSTEDQQNFQTLIDSKNLLIEHQNQRLSLYEEEIKRLKAKVCKERFVNDNELDETSSTKINLELKVTNLQKEKEQMSDQFSHIKTQNDDKLRRLSSELDGLREEVIRRHSDKSLFDNKELNEMRSSIETLQKEIIDRQFGKAEHTQFLYPPFCAFSVSDLGRYLNFRRVLVESEFLTFCVVLSLY
uniref:Uncharacterized protein n=1 Tax=Romanomermis culicivorax TaxID=13658 RepID=A0A915IYH0_ROMCU